jgi:hypothetical protein
MQSLPRWWKFPRLNKEQPMKKLILVVLLLTMEAWTKDAVQVGNPVEGERDSVLKANSIPL